MDIQTLAVAMSYTDMAALGLADISVSGTNILITYSGGETAVVTVPVPDDGISVTGANVTQNNHLVLTLSNNTTIDAGVITTLKGDKGDTGETGVAGITPTITATATVDANVGTPSVSITKTGTDANPSFAFAFHNIKGEDGSGGGSDASVEGETVIFTEGSAIINDESSSSLTTYSSSKIESLIGGGGGGGTTVVVNPILSGDEETATSIKVGNEKYVFPNTNTYGFTPAQITMFEGILRAAVYSSDQSSAITAFIDSLNEQPVVPKVLTSITATKTKTNYYTDETFSTADVVVTAHYDDNTTANVTSNATIGTVDITSAGTKSLSISYSEGGVTKTASISIIAEVRPLVKTLSSITASVTNTSVNQGETYSPQGLSVTAYYSDDTNSDVTSSASVGTIDTSSAGNKTLTVSYTEDGVTKTYDITIEVVAPVVLSSITAVLTGTYTTENAISDVTSHITTTAHYSNGTTATVVGTYDTSGVTMSTAGTYSIGVSYTEGGITETTSVSLTVTDASAKSYVTTQYMEGRRANNGIMGSHSGSYLCYAEVQAGVTYKSDYKKLYELGHCSAGYVKDKTVESITLPYTPESNEWICIRVDKTTQSDLRIYSGGTSEQGEYDYQDTITADIESGTFEWENGLTIDETTGEVISYEGTGTGSAVSPIFIIPAGQVIRFEHFLSTSTKFARYAYENGVVGNLIELVTSGNDIYTNSHSDTFAYRIATSRNSIIGLESFGRS